MKKTNPKVFLVKALIFAAFFVIELSLQLIIGKSKLHFFILLLLTGIIVFCLHSIDKKYNTREEELETTKYFVLPCIFLLIICPILLKNSLLEYIYDEYISYMLIIIGYTLNYFYLYIREKNKF